MARSEKAMSVKVGENEWTIRLSQDPDRRIASASAVLEGKKLPYQELREMFTEDGIERVLLTCGLRPQVISDNMGVSLVVVSTPFPADMDYAGVMQAILENKLHAEDKPQEPPSNSRVI